MLSQKPIRYLLVPATLLALLLSTMAVSGFCHHHSTSSCANCPICHLSHQPMERTLAADRTPTLAPIEIQAQQFEPRFTPSPVIPRLDARAPPLA
jgi:hypothetical protein